jgi:hypothetical protein
MTEDRQRYGPLIATAGAALLAVSVFLPWYALSATASGIAYIQQEANNVALQYGNATLQSEVGSLHTRLSALAGHQLATLSAHQTLKYLGVVLLILAAIAFIAGLLRLAGAAELPLAGSGQIALVGLMATVCVLFRMADPPTPEEGLLSLSLSGGIWLALGSSLAIVVGGLWPRRISRPNVFAATPEKVWDGLSGWTPDA